MAVTTFGVFAAMTAQAQICSTTCNRYEEGQCVEHRQTCTTPSAPADSYGAIAYGKTSGAWGFSYSWASRAKAESVASQNCAQNAKDCQVVVWFNHKCGAVAADQGNETYWGIGDTVSQAQAVAQKTCVKGGGKSCEVKVSQCSR